ncbi:rhamnogalacturonan acetylesterase [Roseateles asaccharophilus]|uniref:Lysophospholipase L1-like esterase n=1 Tax=Roseateles asaccharophilus TaxID=582607 RepID=A0ABU2A3Q1_9BURK|nr:rhamnogalacturonan acetylesterase [Roseateles asaccharophilus]MDR7331152.1 lysophospholipase L1-like esterase [Roseateles asaccharophilus]
MKHLLLITTLLATAASAQTLRFTFDGKPAQGEIAIANDTVYSRERGHGFEADDKRNAAGQPYFFSVDLPDGNYRVTATLGSKEASDTTIKAELRRLQLDGIKVPAGATQTHSFLVNVRTANITATHGVEAGRVKLKDREISSEAWAWDRRLTLEINGQQPALQRLTIEPVKAPTVYLLGDSTVADQSGEPYASWGQMLTVLFKPTVAVSNHAESGETFRDSLNRRRIDKILSMLQPGDTVLLQFGHNDQKQQKDGSGNAETYKAEMRTHAQAIQARGGIPVIVSSMERRNFDPATAKLRPSLTEYANAARTVAQDMKLAFIDLNAMSIQFYEALGPERSQAAHPMNNGKLDNTHHNNYGAMQLARLIAQGLREARVPVAAQLRDDLGAISPAQPPAPEQFRVATSPGFTQLRPLGD